MSSKMIDLFLKVNDWLDENESWKLVIFLFLAWSILFAAIHMVNYPITAITYIVLVMAFLIARGIHLLR